MKLNSRKPNSSLTFFGAILIILGLLVLITQIVIKHGIWQSIPMSLRDSYHVSVYRTWTGYDVSIKFSPEDDRFKDDSVCGYTALKFLNEMSYKRTGMDKRIKHYNFSFMADSSVAYTAAYDNTVDSDNKMLAFANKQPKSLQEYTAEAYKLRNAGSTLFQYDHDNHLKYFLIDDASITFDNKKPTIKFNFKNTSDKKYNEVYIAYAFIYDNGNVSDNHYATFYNLEAGKTYILTIQEGYVKECNFIITVIRLFSEGNPEKQYFLFD